MHRAEEFTQSTHQLLICVGKTLLYGAIIALEPSKHWTLQHNRVQSIMPVTQFINALEKGTTQTVRGRLTSFYLLLWYSDSRYSVVVHNITWTLFFTHNLHSCPICTMN